MLGIEFGKDLIRILAFVEPKTISDLALVVYRDRLDKGNNIGAGVVVILDQVIVNDVFEIAHFFWGEHVHLFVSGRRRRASWLELKFVLQIGIRKVMDG